MGVVPLAVREEQLLIYDVENSVSFANYIPRGGLSPVIRYDILSAELYDCPFRMSCNRGAVRYFVKRRRK